MSEAKIYALYLQRAVIVFANEYGDRYPVENLASEGDTDVTSALGSATIRILLGKDDVLNPRKTDFLGDMKQGILDNKARWNCVVSSADPSGTASYGVVDPWGNPYQIRMDTNYDKKVADPRSPGLPPVGTTVLVWSAGADRDPATWEGNIKSWKDNSVQPAVK